MATSPARASSRWLALREPADAAARAQDLVEELRPHLGAAARAEIHDLGCGTGSMARWLAPRLEGPQHWVMYDRDDDLLPLAAAHPPTSASNGAPVSVETHRGDITRLDRGALADASLVTASALLDMMTAAELGRLVEVCAGAGCPVLLTLSVVGRAELAPYRPFDTPVMEAFNAHQRRVTGAGRLLGPDAVAAAADAFGRCGLDVLIRPSPWRLGPDHRPLLREWFTGWVAAACAQRPELRHEASDYTRQRLREMVEGGLEIVVHHEDLLALHRAP